MDAAVAQLDQLRRIPFVESVAWGPPTSPAADASLKIRTPTKEWELAVELKTSHLGPAVVRDFIARAERTGEPWILLAPFVSRPSAALLAEHGINFVDRSGNHRLALGAGFHSTSLGNAFASGDRAPGLRLAGQRALFAVLADPTLAAAPVRTLATAAGTSKNAAAAALRRLADDKLLVQTSAGRTLVGLRSLRSRWVEAYVSSVRRQLLVGRFELPMRDPGDRERHLEKVLAEHEGWAFGGTSGAHRLAPHYRGPEVALVVENRALAAELVKAAGLRAAREGTVALIETPGPLGLRGPLPRVAHPLLVYAELVAENNDRATEAAAELAEHFLKDGPG